MAAATIRTSVRDAQHLATNLRKLAQILRKETPDNVTMAKESLGTEVATLFGLGKLAREQDAKFCEELAAAIKVAARVIEDA